MTQEAIYDKVAALIKDQVGEGAEVTEASSLQDDFFSDSVELMEFIITLEDEFDIEISDEEADGLTNLKDLVRYLAEKMEN